VATESYLEETAGGLVAAAAFADDETAVAAVTLLRESGVRPQDISVIAQDRQRAALIAGDRAWLPRKGWSGILSSFLGRLSGGLPGEVRRRYGKAIRQGKVVIAVAAGGQPADTVAALLGQAGGGQVEQWWQAPTQLFAPPELAGPF
jgi:hypothetical protein